MPRNMALAAADRKRARYDRGVPHEIRTPRLRLPTLGPDLLRALLAGSTREAGERIDARMPDAWDEMLPVFRMRLAELERAPEDEAWLTRAIVLARERQVIGVTGFHGRPSRDPFGDDAPVAAQLGYSIFPPHRRCGYASEAAGALIAWALREHGVRDFVLSIAHGNAASRAVAARLGFQPAGEWTHPQRGVEQIHRLRAEPRPRP